MSRLAALALVGLLCACTAVPTGGYQPIGFSTYGKGPNGERVRLWTDYQTGTTTGTIGGQSVRLRSY